jgi:hypothetical protein
VAALDFPSSPTVGQVYTANGKSWQWDGVSWISYNTLIAAGSNTQIQFNNSGAFGASAGLTWNGTTLTTTGLNNTGNTTLGDASGDTLTINGTAVSCPNNLNFDSNTLFIDAANNRVGINTNTPAYGLDVQVSLPSGSGSVAVSRIYGYVPSGLTVGAEALSVFGLKQGANAVAEYAAISGKISAFNGGGQISLYTNVVNGSLRERLAIDHVGSFFLRTSGDATKNSVSLNSTVENALVLDSSGRLIVGAASSSYKFDVVGGDTRLAQSSTTAGLTVYKPSSSGAGTESAILDLAGNNAVSAQTTYASLNTYIIANTPGAESGGLVFKTRLTGTLAERFRLTPVGTQVIAQPDPIAINATAVMGNTDILARIITSTTNAAVNCTVPSGPSLDTAVYSSATNMGLDWSVINTGPNTLTVIQNINHTLVGAMAVAAGTVGLFRSRRTATNTWITYRIG